MRTKRLKTLFLVFLFISSFNMLLSQSRTGSITGRVLDEEGTALPGATVTISSPSMMGTQSFVSGANGNFRFPACPPGRYLVNIELAGFQKVERPGIIVNVGANSDFDITLVPATLEEEVTVVAAAPIVDTKSSKMSSSITNEMIKNVPIGRDIYDLVRIAPSVVDEGPGTEYRKMVSIHGGTLQQTTYALDGVNLSDPYRGYVSKGVAFDAIEEVEMIGGSVSADVSQSMGGYINVVSKSGGNVFSGGITAQYTGENLQLSVIPESQIKAMGLDTPVYDKINFDLSLAFGGPIIKDRLWFFVNPRIVRWIRPNMFIPFTDPTGKDHGSFDSEHWDYTGFVKLSAQIAPNLKYMGMWQYLDLRENAISLWNNWWRPLDAHRQWVDYAHTFTNVLTWIWDQNTFFDAKVAYVFRRMDTLDIPFHEGRPAPRANDRVSGYQWGSSGADEHYERHKWQTELTATRYMDDFLGANHEFKVGAEYIWWSSYAEMPRVHPYRQYWYNETPWYYGDREPYWGRLQIGNGGPNEGDAGATDLCKTLGFFVQDSINIGEKLTLNVGIRYNVQHVSTPEEYRKGWVDTYYNGLAQVLAPEIFATEDWSVPALKDVFVWSKLQPRIGIVYDIFGNGKTALKASFARYAENFLSAMTGGLHPLTNKSVSFYWWDDNHNGVYDLPPIDRYRDLGLPRIFFDTEEILSQIDSDLSCPYVDEFTVAVQQEVMKDFSITLNAMYKENKNLQEGLDIVNPIGGDMWLPYTVEDPGADGEFGTGDDSELTVYGLKSDAEDPYRYRTNIAEMTRKYWALEFVMFKRMSNNWQFSGSVTYSKHYGNTAAGYYDSQGNRGYWDTPNDLINNYGRLTWDRPLMIKLMGTVILPGAINLSANYNHVDGAPGTRNITVYFPNQIDGFSLKSSSVAVKAEPTGSYRYPSVNNLDLRLEKTFLLFNGRLGLFLDLVNVLGYSRVNVDQNLGGYIYADGSFKPSPTYGKITSTQGIALLKITLRYTF